MKNNEYQNGNEVMSKDDFTNLWYYKKEIKKDLR